MLKSIFIVLKKIFFVLIIFIAHIWVINILPYPFEHINLIFIVLFLYLLLDEEEKFLWYVLIFGFLLELFVTSSFGITLLALFFCFLSVKWLLTYFLTNRSIYIIIFASTVSLFIYRVYYLALISIVNFFFKEDFLYTSRTAADYAYEIALSAIVITLFYSLISYWFVKLNPRYIKKI